MEVVRLSRAESRQRTRELLVAAAMRVFARCGYAGASVDAIAAEAGFTVGALYSNFGTKQELFLAALERHCAEELAGLRALIEETSGVEELLEELVARATELDEPRREWWQLWVEMWLYAQRHPETAPRFRDIQDETRAAIADALGGGRSPDSEVVALVHALWTGFWMYRVINPEALPAAGFGRGVRRLLAAEH